MPTWWHNACVNQIQIWTWGLIRPLSVPFLFCKRDWYGDYDSQAGSTRPHWLSIFVQGHRQKTLSKKKMVTYRLHDVDDRFAICSNLHTSNVPTSTTMCTSTTRWTTSITLLTCQAVKRVIVENIHRIPPLVLANQERTGHCVKGFMGLQRLHFNELCWIHGRSLNMQHTCKRLYTVLLNGIEFLQVKWACLLAHFLIQHILYLYIIYYYILIYYILLYINILYNTVYIIILYPLREIQFYTWRAPVHIIILK